MKVHPHITMGLTAGAFLLIGTLAVAQSSSAGSPASTKAAAATVVHPRDAATGQASGRRQDQFGHASGVAGTSSTQPANSAESRKHIAGVKYEDRTASTPQGALSGQPSAKGIQEKGLNSTGAAQPNEMAIKENGISASKPKPKP